MSLQNQLLILAAIPFLILIYLIFFEKIFGEFFDRHLKLRLSPLTRKWNRMINYPDKLYERIMFYLNPQAKFDRCLNVISQTAKDVSKDHDYKFCYYKPESILSYKINHIFECANYLKNHVEDRVQDKDRQIELLNSIDLIIGMLHGYISISSKDLPTDTEENYVVGNQIVGNLID